MIHELLHHGAQNAVSVAELSETTGMGERRIRELTARRVTA